jgi:acetyltransferase
MEVEQVRSAVMAAIRSVAPEADPRRIEPGRPLLEQIDLDSMDRLNVALALQERLGVDIPDAEIGPRATVDSILAYVASRLGELPGAPAAQAPIGPRETHHVINCKSVTVRPIRREDKPLEAEFVRHLSDDARYMRFMATLRELSKTKLDYLTDVDQVRHVALIATVERDGQPAPVGVVRYVVDAPGSGCEFSIVVDDAWTRSGLAGILMRELMAVARSRGLATMEGIVLAANAPMLRFARQLGFTQERDPEDLTTVRIVRAL